MRYRWAWEGQTLEIFLQEGVCRRGAQRGRGRVKWEETLRVMAVNFSTFSHCSHQRCRLFLVISVMALSPFVKASAEWYNWAGGQIFCCPVEQQLKGEGILYKCCLPFSMQCHLFPSGVLVGAVMVFKCLALSMQTVFVTCLLHLLWQCPALNTAQNLRMASLRPGPFSFAGAGGNRQNPSQRPLMDWHLKKEKAQATERGLND